MAKRRAPKCHCALCSKVLFGFDDDMELRALSLPSGHELAPFPGQFMCGDCFESWPLRTQYGHHRVEYIQKEPEKTTRESVYSDERCLLQIEIETETVSWRPLTLQPKSEHRAGLWLRSSGTELVISLSEWGNSIPKPREDKRLRPCEKSALQEIWNGLTEKYPTGAEILAEVDVDSVLRRHEQWLNRDRESGQ